MQSQMFVCSVPYTIEVASNHSAVCTGTASCICKSDYFTEGPKSDALNFLRFIECTELSAIIELLHVRLYTSYQNSFSLSFFSLKESVWYKELQVKSWCEAMLINFF